MEAVTASSAAGATAAELEGALVATTQESQRLAAELAETRASGNSPAAGAGSAPGSADTQDLLAEVTGLRAGARAGEPRGRSAAPHGDPGPAGVGRVPGRRRGLALSQGPARTQAATPPRQLALTAAPASDAVRRLQQDLADAQATVATLDRSRGPQRDRGRRGPPMRLPSWSRSRSRSGARTGRRSSSAPALPGSRHRAATPPPLPRRRPRPVQHPCPSPPAPR